MAGFSIIMPVPAGGIGTAAKSSMKRKTSLKGFFILHEINVFAIWNDIDEFNG